LFSSTEEEFYLHRRENLKSRIKNLCRKATVQSNPEDGEKLWCPTAKLHSVTTQ